MMSHYLRSSSILGLLILMGKALGFTRELILANQYGANSDSDIAILLLTFPDILVNVLISGGLAASLTPLLVKFESPLSQRQVSAFLSICVFVVFAILAFILFPLQEKVFSLLSPSLDTQKILESYKAYCLTLIAVPLTAVAGVTTCFFNARRKFLRGGVGTVVFNIAIIVSLLLGKSLSVFNSISIGVVIGSLIRLLIMHEAFLCLPFKLQRVKSYINFSFIKNFMVNFTFSTSIVLSLVLSRTFASTSSVGALSLFSYVIKFVELPVGILMGVLSTLILTQRKISIKVLNKYGYIFFALTMFISIPVIWQPQLLTYFLDIGRKFSPEQVNSINTMIRCGFIFLPFQVLALYFSTVYAKVEARKVLFCNSIILFGLVLLLNLVFSFRGVLGSFLAYEISFMILVLVNLYQNKFLAKKF